MTTDKTEQYLQRRVTELWKQGWPQSQIIQQLTAVASLAHSKKRLLEIVNQICK